MTQVSNSEVLIVGAGIAGICCAIELLEQGKHVTMIDRDLEDNLGGLAKWSFGGLFFVDSKHQRKAGIKDSIDQAKEDWWSCAQFNENDVWGQKWADQFLHLCTSDGYRWLRKLGVNFFPVLGWAERGLLRQGNSVPRFHITMGTGWGLTETLVQHLLSHPKRDHLTFKFQMRVTELVIENGSVKGVQGIDEVSGESFEERADSTVVATGGINGDIEKVRRHWYKPWGKPPQTILNGAHEFAVGDLHDATEKIDGSVVNLDKQWNYAAGIRHYAPRHKDHGLSLVPGKSQLWLNYQGRRFGPPSLMSPFDTRYVIEQICKEPIKYSWQILNSKIARKEFAISGSEHNQAIRDKRMLKFVFQTLFTGNMKLVDKIAERCEDFVVADTLPELIDKMNALTGEKHVEYKFVEEAAKSYDRQISLAPHERTDDQIRRILEVRKYRGERARTCNLQPILDPKAGPLIAIRSFILSRKSLGGIQTDLQCRVLTKATDGSTQVPIPGLYAIGEAAGFGGVGFMGRVLWRVPLFPAAS